MTYLCQLATANSLRLATFDKHMQDPVAEIIP